LSDKFTIAELAGEFGVSLRTIRFYEDKLLLQPKRQGMTRVFSRRDRARLSLILRGKRLGFGLKEIKEMLDLYDPANGQVEQLRVLLQRSRERLMALERQRGDIDEAIMELREACSCVSAYLQCKAEGDPVPSLSAFLEQRNVQSAVSRRAGAPVSAVMETEGK